MVQLRIFVSFRKEIRRLSYEEKGQLLDAMLAYAEDKTLLPLTGKADVLWDVIQERIDAQQASYDEKCRNIEKGRTVLQNSKLSHMSNDESHMNLIRGEDNLSLHNFEVQEQVQVKVQEQDKSSNKRESKRFAPPTADQVREYCLENGLGVDPENFVDYYTSNGWKVGGKTPMKDWKATVRRWARGDKENNTGSRGKTIKFDYAQREYKDSDFEHLYLDLDKDPTEGT